MLDSDEGFNDRLSTMMIVMEIKMSLDELNIIFIEFAGFNLTDQVYGLDINQFALPV